MGKRQKKKKKKYEKKGSGRPSAIIQGGHPPSCSPPPPPPSLLQPPLPPPPELLLLVWPCWRRGRVFSFFFFCAERALTKPLAASSSVHAFEGLREKAPYTRGVPLCAYTRRRAGWCSDGSGFAEGWGGGEGWWGRWRLLSFFFFFFNLPGRKRLRSGSTMAGNSLSLCLSLCRFLCCQLRNIYSLCVSLYHPLTMSLSL